MTDYTNLTTEELLSRREGKMKEIVRKNTEQMAIKIFMNSLYGAIG